MPRVPTIDKKNDITVNLDVIYDVGIMPAVLYGVLVWLTDGSTDKFFMTAKELGELIGLSRYPIPRYLKILHRKGYITMEYKHGIGYIIQLKNK